jgi:hypothetical protein
MKNNDDSAAWEELLSSAARLQKIVPEAVLVGGTAAALFTRHRVSFDADHVLSDLRERFDDPLPFDLEKTNLSIYKHLVPQWRNWTAVKIACIEASQVFGELGE